MSGDKLLGGPQAGIILGKAEVIDAMKRNPLCRALRVDKLTLAALEATLQSYVRGQARQEIPTLRMIATSKAEITDRAKLLAAQLPEAAVVDGESTIGGGAYPGISLPTSLITLNVDAAKLRVTKPHVITRAEKGRVVIDLRTVLPEQEPLLLQALRDV
jgi:L-seryl-tRNA(Ser) seleniumtransferase